MLAKGKELDSADRQRGVDSASSRTCVVRPMLGLKRSLPEAEQSYARIYGLIVVVPDAPRE
jgi:hypothetical protein